MRIPAPPHPALPAPADAPPQPDGNRYFRIIPSQVPRTPFDQWAMPFILSTLGWILFRHDQGELFLILFLVVQSPVLFRRPLEDRQLLGFTASELLPASSGPLLCAGLGGIRGMPSAPQNRKAGRMLILTPSELTLQDLRLQGPGQSPELNEVTRIPLHSVRHLSLSPANFLQPPCLTVHLIPGREIRFGDGPEVVLDVADAEAWQQAISPLLRA